MLKFCNMKAAIAHDLPYKHTMSFINWKNSEQIFQFLIAAFSA